MPVMNTQAQLERIYEKASSVSSRHAVNAAIDWLDDMLAAGQFAECDKAFELADVEKLPNSVIVSFLGITSAARDKLPERRKFYDRAKEVVANRRGGIERAEKLLAKYLQPL